MRTNFTLTSACTIKRITVEGKYFKGYGPAASVAITLHHDGDGKPGSVLPGVDQTSNRCSGPSQDGNLPVKLKHSLTWRTGCTTYTNVRTCLGDVGPSMIFTILS
jgi:hypothetical protein